MPPEAVPLLILNAYEFETEVDSRLESGNALIKSSRRLRMGLSMRFGQASVLGDIPVLNSRASDSLAVDFGVTRRARLH